MPVVLSGTARRLLDGRTYVTLSTVNPTGARRRRSSGPSATATTC